MLSIRALIEVSEGCSCQVNTMQCTNEGIETVVGKYIRWKSVQLASALLCSKVGQERALLTILLMCGFHERLFDISMPR